MKPTEIKFMLWSSDLSKTQAFYSTLGVTWNGDEEIKIGQSGLPERVEQYAELESLPHLWGDLGNNEFMFYFDKLKPPEPKGAATILMVYYDDPDILADILVRLKAQNLFIADAEFDEQFRVLILDPDGRRIELCTPNPFRV